MPQRIQLLCPIDGLQLNPDPTLNLRGSVADDAGDHLHFIVNVGRMQCSNGHAWSIRNDVLTMVREA